MRLTAVMSMAAKAAFPKDYRYGTNRPRTIAAKRLNPPGKKRRKVFIELIAYEDWSVFKGDTVEILSGKDKGKQGKLAQVFRHRNWVILDGLNTVRIPVMVDTLEKTYTPSLKTLEEEVMEKLGIEEPRRNRKTY
ncbi:unnamed protein product, partial [Coregonus sp. 'balchen']